MPLPLAHYVLFYIADFRRTKRRHLQIQKGPVGVRNRPAYSLPPAPISVSLIGSRSPARAARTILRATISTIGSLLAVKPSLFKAAEKAIPIASRSSGPNARLSPKNCRIGTEAPQACEDI